ncbi:MAG: hypothetical protein ACJ79K_17180 [Gemmatimonadaceae bacterium]
MTNLQVGLIVAGAMTVVFAAAASLLAALERAPGLRGTAAVPGSPSRALAVPMMIGALALLASSVAYPLPSSHRVGTLIILVGGSAGLLVHAGSAFVRGERAQRRMVRGAHVILVASVVSAAFVFWRA